MKIQKGMLLAVLPTLLWSGGILARPLHPCRSTDKKEYLSCLKKRYKEVDGELNRVYKSLRAIMDSATALEMRNDSRNWIGYRDYLCQWQKEMNQDNSGESSYEECMIKMTLERTKFLETAFGKKGVSQGKNGLYDDGRGGSLSLKCSKMETAGTRVIKESCSVSISVTRGPTAHVGDVGGSFLLKNGKGVYEEQGNECRDGMCCHLEFSYEKQKLTVRNEKQCDAYRGLRAYFGGTYRKVR